MERSLTKNKTTVFASSIILSIADNLNLVRRKRSRLLIAWTQMHPTIKQLRRSLCADAPLNCWIFIAQHKPSTTALMQHHVHCCWNYEFDHSRDFCLRQHRTLLPACSLEINRVTPLLVFRRSMVYAAMSLDLQSKLLDRNQNCPELPSYVYK